MKRWAVVAVVVGLAGGLAGHEAGRAEGAKKMDRVFELRTYHVPPGKLDALNARFRDHTNKLFHKHGMTIVGFWTPTDGAQAKNTLIYLLAFPSREAAARSWQAFREDPEWQRVKAASEKEGKLVEKVDSVFLAPTNYSPLK